MYQGHLHFKLGGHQLLGKSTWENAEEGISEFALRLGREFLKCLSAMTLKPSVGGRAQPGIFVPGRIFPRDVASVWQSSQGSLYPITVL